MARPLPSIGENQSNPPKGQAASSRDRIEGLKQNQNFHPDGSKAPADSKNDDYKPVPVSVTPKPGASKASGAARRSQNARDPNSVHNVVTKFSFATKGGIAAHNPYKVN